jgi:hypothetical protein
MPLLATSYGISMSVNRSKAIGPKVVAVSVYRPGPNDARYVLELELPSDKEIDASGSKPGLDAIASRSICRESRTVVPLASIISTRASEPPGVVTVTSLEPGTATVTATSTRLGPTLDNAIERSTPFADAVAEVICDARKATGSTLAAGRDTEQAQRAMTTSTSVATAAILLTCPPVCLTC